MNYRDGLRKVLAETSMTDSGVFGSAAIGNQGGNFGNVDFYAPGDARNVFGYDLEPKSKKKRKKKKGGSFPLYRRAFTEDVIQMNEPVLGCAVFCVDPYRDLALKLVERMQLSCTIEDGVLMINSTDDCIRSFIDTLCSTVGESVFMKHYLALVCEMSDMQSVFKKPKQRQEDYNQDQLRIGTEVELEHTEDRNVARVIAMQHLDEDPTYYDKLRKIEPAAIDKIKKSLQKERDL